MIEIIIKREQGNLVLKLNEPDFDAYRMATMAIQSESGKIDKLAAGKIILQTCCTEGLKEVEKDKKAFISACFDAYDLLTLYETEVKKK